MSPAPHPAEALPAFPKSPPQAILFDWDGTLVDNWSAVHDALNEVLVAHGREPWPLSTIKAGGRSSARQSFPKLFGESAPEARDRFVEGFVRRHLEALTVLSGAVELLDALAGVGIPLGIVSNKQGRFVRTEAEYLGWTQRFGALIGAGDAAADKPDPAPALLALQRLELQPSGDIWFVGDSDVDIACAVALGATPILLESTPEAVLPYEDGMPLPTYRFPELATFTHWTRMALGQA